MNTDHLKSFITVVEEGSISSAAKKLYITSPSLHQQIHLLEKEVGFPLFQKKGTRLVLNEAGHSFYESSKEILSNLESSVLKAKTLYDSEKKSLKIGYLGATDFYVLKHLAAGSYFHLKPVKIEWSGFKSMPNLVRKKEIDAMICEYVFNTSQDLTFKVIGKDSIAAMVSEENPLANKEYIEDFDLWKHKIYMFAYDGENPLIPIVKDKYPELKIQLIDDSSETIFHICENGGVILAEETWLRQTFPLPILPFTSKIEIPFGLLYTENNNAKITQFIADIGL